jgi:hypothetical protein
MNGPCVHDLSGAERMNDQRWKELCRLIMSEQDPHRLWKLVSDLNQEFERREMDLRSQKNSESERPAAPDPTSGNPEEST